MRRKIIIDWPIARFPFGKLQKAWRLLPARCARDASGLSSLGAAAGSPCIARSDLLIAGLVRGFSGFALSAMVMASGALILPPVQLIPSVGGLR